MYKRRVGISPQTTYRYSVSELFSHYTLSFRPVPCPQPTLQLTVQPTKRDTTHHASYCTAHPQLTSQPTYSHSTLQVIAHTTALNGLQHILPIRAQPTIQRVARPTGLQPILQVYSPSYRLQPAFQAIIHLTTSPPWRLICPSHRLQPVLQVTAYYRGCSPPHSLP
jgi:hypothetical protein